MIKEVNFHVLLEIMLFLRQILKYYYTTHYLNKQ